MRARHQPADPVTIKQVEVEIVDRAWDDGWVSPQPPPRLTGRTVAVVGSGPGRARRCAAADPRRAHRGGASSGPTASAACCATASPSSRWRSGTSTAGSTRCAAEGTRFRAGVNVGVDITGADLRGATTPSCWPSARPRWRELPCPGRELGGIHQAMEYLPLANRVQQGDLGASADRRARASTSSIIGGGDTGADCLGTAHRQGAASVTQLEILPRPPDAAADRPAVADVPDDLPRSSAPTRRAASGCSRSTPSEFLGDDDGRVRALRAASRWSCVDGRVRRGRRAPSARSPRDLVLLAMGFVGPERDGAASSSSASTSTRAATSPATRRTRPTVAGRVRRRRRRSRPVAHRVGDRRGARAARGRPSTAG